MHADPDTRAAAVTHTYFVWQRDQTLGFSVLKHLADNVMHAVVPDLPALESFIGLSLAIFFDHAQDAAIVGRLQILWQEVLSKILGIDARSGKVGTAARNILRQRMFSFATSYLFRILKQLPDYNPINYGDLQAFFTVSPAEKALYRRLVSYLELDRFIPAEEMMPDLLAVLPRRSLFIEMVFTLVVNGRMARYPDETLPIVIKLLEKAEQDPVRSPYLGSLTQSLQSALDQDPSRDDIFHLFEYWMKICQHYYAETSSFPGLNRKQESLRVTFTGWYIVDLFHRTGSVESSWLRERISRAAAEKDNQYFHFLISMELVQVGIDKGLVTPALEVLAIVLECDDRSSDINRQIELFLAKMRSRYPDEVTHFMDEHQMTAETRLFVTTNEPSDTVGSFIGMRVWDFILHEALVNSTTLRRHLLAILTSATNFKSLEAWMDYTLREVLNTVYGAVILPQVNRTTDVP
jgi:hypothetical protein